MLVPLLFGVVIGLLIAWLYHRATGR